MALSTNDDILAAEYAEQVTQRHGWFTASAPEAAGVTHCLSTAGKWPANEKITFPNVSTNHRHLKWMFGQSNTAGSFILYDILSEVTGISINSTGNKTVNTPALTRYTDGVGVECLIEVTTVSAAAAVISVNSYTDDAGNTGQAGATVTFPATVTNVNTCFFMPMATGDLGMRAISTINVATSGAGSCAVRVMLVKRLGVELGLGANIGMLVDTRLQVNSFDRIYDGAQLQWCFRATATTALRFEFGLGTVYG
jgi:hypothetical protein